MPWSNVDKLYGFSYSKNLANFEAFGYKVISSSIVNLLFPTADALTWINAGTFDGTSLLASSSLITVSWDSLIWDADVACSLDEIAKIWGFLLGESRSCRLEEEAVMGFPVMTEEDIPVMGWILLGKVYEHWYVDLPPRVRSSRIAKYENNH